ncbi:hypothetical protein TBLA_0H02430 [Henningerozyma blattae CBS 6284]|uniref:Ribosomal RNA-processing protein 41 n=1 Tax=Henningerozyma blattae (strain ATCC 34711 / CBS 6284 / DSM 70876 / NBRC 10599 / NRRL Y-10934 / UCD 77-7) TaxID=1071380 RepID=I2H825_HENB6|nr:hypothetical protein TBLA_0H02430 [Tetrapisispora blattae CBS 6284]CCH62527.1 hypothetical protein TBLA_0H02430 [Tetrapisispora blattae CBS 6284]
MSRLEVYSPEGLRQDGRRWNELRRFDCSINTHAHTSDGSSYLEQGNNKVITIVKGPQEPPLKSQLDQTKATLNISLNITPFSKFERSKTQHKNEKRILELQTILIKTFKKNILMHLYPRTLIDIQIHVLQQDGSLLSCLINGITLALIDAGIAIYDFISGISIGLFNETPLLDLNSQEEIVMSSVTLGVVGNSEKLSLLFIEDKLPLDIMENVLAIGIAGAHRIKDLMDIELKRHAKERLLKQSK